MTPEDLAEKLGKIIANQENMKYSMSQTTKILRGVKMEKDCLLSKTNGDVPVRQRELQRVYKLIWWILGIVGSGGVGTAGYFFLK